MAPADRVRIIDISTVSLPRTTSGIDPIKLAFFDVMWIFCHPVERVFFYQMDTSQYPSHLHRLKQSLSYALQNFLPLSGKLVYSVASDDLEINCTDPGVKFIEAESDEELAHLVGNDVHDAGMFRALVPELEIDELPAPLLSVKVTRFAEGLAIGITVHHVPVDGFGACYFLKSWAEMCRNGLYNVEAAVSWDRSALRDPESIQICKALRKTFAPDLPKLKILRAETQDLDQLMRRTFIATSTNIRSLKAQAMHGRDDGAVPVSTFVAVMALVWVCGTRARELKNDLDTDFYFLADCRRHFCPPQAETIYFANCVRPCSVKAKAFQLLAKDGFPFAVKAIEKSVHEALKKPPKDNKTWLGSSWEIAPAWMNVAGAPRFKVYEMDFGWGRPSRVELVSVHNEGYIGFSDAREGGGVQLSVALSPLHMDKFASLFLHGLDGGVEAANSYACSEFV